MLYKEDPERIVPFLRPYHGDINSSNWYLKDWVFSYMLKRLEMPIYKGVGEFHIHNPFDADSVAAVILNLLEDRELWHNSMQRGRVTSAQLPTASTHNEQDAVAIRELCDNRLAESQI